MNEKRAREIPGSIHYGPKSNERIAEWLGWVRLDEPEADIPDGILEWKMPSGAHVQLRWFDRFIGEWHGSDGLFAKIKKRRLWMVFLDQLLKDTGIFVAIEDDGSEWVEKRRIFDLLTIKPSRLAATLLKVIDEEQNDKR